MTTQKKTKAVSAGTVATGVKPGGPVGTTVLPSGVGSGAVTVGAVSTGSAASGPTTIGLTTNPATRLPNGFRGALQQMLQGVQTVVPDGSSLTAVNGTYTKADMVSTLQSALALYTDVSAQEQVLITARITLKNGVPAARQYYAELKGVLTGFFHAGNPILTDFGFKPKKASTPQTVAKKAAAVVRNSQTREMRGTLGKKEKLAIKYTGPVTGAGVPSTASGAVSAPSAAALSTSAILPDAGAVAVPGQTLVASPAKPAGQ